MQDASEVGVGSGFCWEILETVQYVSLRYCAGH